MAAKFETEAGVTVHQISAVCVDELSFIDAGLFGHLDQRLRTLTRCADVPFGGLPVLLCGDNYQKPPPRSDPW